jgi:hypothetical protein
MTSALLDEIHDAILRSSGGIAMRFRRSCCLLVLICGILICGAPLGLSLVLSAELLNDPKGFHGIPWGAPLHERTDMALVEPGDRIRGYELKDSSVKFGEAQVESVRFFTIDGKFARVVARYTGEKTHKQVLAYIESRFGPADRSPGSMMRGLNQEFTWLGEETSVSLVYAAGHRQRGNLFIESRQLAPLFMDAIGGA